MTDTAITAEIHQSLDVHRNLATKITFNDEIRNCVAESCYLGLRKVLDLGVRRNTCHFANLLRSGASNPID